LVGRSDELRKLKRVLTSTHSLATVEGDNGAGKSSLVAIAGYQLYRDVRLVKTAVPIVALRDHFQPRCLAWLSHFSMAPISGTVTPTAWGS